MNAAALSSRAYGRGAAASCLLVGLAVTSCGGTPSKPHAPVLPARPPAAPSPATTPARTKAHCPVSRSDVERAVGRPVLSPVGDIADSSGCVFRLTDGSGGVQIGVEHYRSAKSARDSVESQYAMAGHCCSRTRIPQLGQDGVSITGKTSGGTTVMALAGVKVLVVSVDPLPAVSLRAATDLAVRSEGRI